MTRLAVLMAITLVALYAVMSVYGAGDRRKASRDAVQPAVQSAARDAGGNPRTTSDPAAVPAASAPLEDIVQATSQTPQQVQRFPGPPLRPSPEYAGMEPARTTDPLADAAGPVVYVTGNRVNFRAGPSTGDRVIGSLEAGAPVEALGPLDASWVNIRDGAGRIGYISGQFLASAPPD